MAFDLDEEELKATRKMNKADRKDIEVGEYVRINNDFRLIALGIGKVIGINEDSIHVKMNFELPFSFKKENIANHSKQLIDLIEDKDILEIELSEEFVEKKDKKKLIQIGDIYTKETLQKDIDNGIITRILTILSYNQYMANCYKVGGEE